MFIIGRMLKYIITISIFFETMLAFLPAHHHLHVENEILSGKAFYSVVNVSRRLLLHAFTKMTLTKLPANFKIGALIQAGRIKLI